MDKKCFIVEDLMPLYNEQLLKFETAMWVEEHLNECESCRKLAELTRNELPKERIKSSIDNDMMFKKINRRLSIYQIIFVALSFFFAINTSLLNSSFKFILWYTVLGLVTYLFYKDMKIVFLVSFIPIFLWSVGENVISYLAGNYDNSITWIKFIIECATGAFFNSIIHYIFAVIGSVMGLLICKIRAKE